MVTLKKVSLAGFKSIQKCDELEFRRLNVLIGANGSGKSNLLSFFKMLNYAMSGDLQLFIGKAGGAQSLLHFGPKITPQCSATIEFATDSGNNVYRCRLFHAAPDTLIFAEESFNWEPNDRPFRAEPFQLGAGHRESALLEPKYSKNTTAKVFRDLLPRFRTYQFHDTSEESRMRARSNIADNRYLFSDGGNLAAVLHALQEHRPFEYQRILETIRQVAPFFHDFQLEPLQDNERQVMLNWKAKGSEYEFGPHQLSDGTLRFMALATLLLQPREFLPAMMVIDEPELGMHPYALKVLAALLQDTSLSSQILVATQSAPLVDQVDPDDVIVANMEEGASSFERLNREKLQDWLNEYRLSELWDKNVIGGRP